MPAPLPCDELGVVPHQDLVQEAMALVDLASDLTLPSFCPRPV
jgi:hypothetical protein